MFKKIITLTVFTALLCACGAKTDENTQIVDKTPNSAEVTYMPVATPEPDAAEKAQKKAEQSESEANVELTGEDGSKRMVNLEFQMINNTGIDFMQMFIEPITSDITQIAHGTKRFEDGFVFADKSAINLAPPSGYTLDTSLFNIAAIDINGTGYVFQNIDLASSSTIVLTIENGVPKAIINPITSEGK